MFEPVPDQAESLRRIFHPSAPSLIPLACAGDAADCRRYAAVVMNRLERTGSAPALLDRIDDASDLDRLDAYPKNRRVLLLDQPMRLARWVADRQSGLLILLSHRRDALPMQYATIKSIALSGQIRRFGAFFVDAPDAREAGDAYRRLAACAARFLAIEIVPVSQVSGSLAAMTDASLARLQDYAIALGEQGAAH